MKLKAIVTGLSAFVLLLFLPGISLAAEDDDWLGQDKALHFGASFLLDTAGYFTLRDGAGLTKGGALALAALGTLAVGVAKEISDDEFSGKDLAWNAAGTSVSTALWFGVDRRRDDEVVLTVSPSYVQIHYRHLF